MKSLIGKLIQISINEVENFEKSFSKKILTNFSNGIFPSESELASSLYVSESLITKLCQKLGYSGFRQFNELLKFEYQKYQLDRTKMISDQKVIKEMLETSLNDVNQNSEFVIALRMIVNDTQSLTIFPSYQADNAGIFLRDYLNSKLVNARLWNPARNFIININDYVKVGEPVLFIFTGVDNYQNYAYFEELEKRNLNPIFVITTSGQSGKIDVDYKYILKSNQKYSNTFMREVLLQLIFLETFE